MLEAPQITLDPDFVEAVTLIRRSQTVGADGVATFPETSSNVFMAVMRDREEILKKTPEAAQYSDVIAVYYRGALYARSTSGYSDIVSIGGKRYQVFSVDEGFTNYPGGFTSATCSYEGA